MFTKKPEGYRELLAYQKSVRLQKDILELVGRFHRTKTFLDLADQMSRSARSVTKNIVEGWKRNSTQEYFDFLGFSIGSNSELMEDAADIVTGVYEGLKGIRGIMGETPTQRSGQVGVMRREDLDNIPFYPLSPSLPLAVRVFLQAKEVNFLLYKLQKSLEKKMGEEFTKPQSHRIRETMQIKKKQEQEFNKLLQKYVPKKE